MEFCEFLLPTTAQILNLVQEETQGREDDLAETMAHLAIGINYWRLKRCGFGLLGWSSRSSYSTKDDAKAENEIKQMQADLDNFRYIEENKDEIAGLAAVVKRSSFNHVAVQQV